MMSELAASCYRKYERNLALADAMEKHLPADDGWSVVVRFYAAVHLLNAYLVDKPNVRLDLKSTAHDDRKKALAKCPELRETPKQFRFLKELSEGIRYDPEFEFVAHHRDESKNLLAKIIAIVDPKITKQ